jgi:hypothetical protein
MGLYTHSTPSPNDLSVPSCVGLLEPASEAPSAGGFFYCTVVDDASNDTFSVGFSLDGILRPSRILVILGSA